MLHLDGQVHHDTHAIPMGNYVIEAGKYVIVSPSELGNYKIADTAVDAVAVEPILGRVEHVRAPVVVDVPSREDRPAWVQDAERQETLAQRGVPIRGRQGQVGGARRDPADPGSPPASTTRSGPSPADDPGDIRQVWRDSGSSAAR